MLPVRQSAFRYVSRFKSHVKMILFILLIIFNINTALLHCRRHSFYCRFPSGVLLIVASSASMISTDAYLVYRCQVLEPRYRCSLAVAEYLRAGTKSMESSFAVVRIIRLSYINTWYVRTSCLVRIYVPAQQHSSSVKYVPLPDTAAVASLPGTFLLKSR